MLILYIIVKKSQNILPHPHDRYIRRMMTHPEVARAFLTHYLPVDIRDRMDMQSISLQKETFVDKKLRQQIVDLLFRVDIENDPGYVYVLMEHQSTPDRLLPMRMKQYKMNILDHHIRTFPDMKTLPFIYPLILYTGESPYRYSTCFFNLFGSEKENARTYWSQPFQLVDLNTLDDEELRHVRCFGQMALIAKYARRPEALDILRITLQDLNHLEIKDKKDYLTVMIEYAFQVINFPHEELANVILRTCEEKEGEDIMHALGSLASSYIEEGIKKGMQEGREEGVKEGREEGSLQTQQNVIQNMLKQGFDLETIQKITGIDTKML